MTTFVHKGGRGVKITRNSVHVVCTWPLTQKTDIIYLIFFPNIFPSTFHCQLTLKALFTSQNLLSHLLSKYFSNKYCRIARFYLQYCNNPILDLKKYCNIGLQYYCNITILKDCSKHIDTGKVLKSIIQQLPNIENYINRKLCGWYPLDLFVILKHIDTGKAKIKIFDYTVMSVLIDVSNFPSRFAMINVQKWNNKWNFIFRSNSILTDYAES